MILLLNLTFDQNLNLFTSNDVPTVDMLSVDSVLFNIILMVQWLIMPTVFALIVYYQVGEIPRIIYLSYYGCCVIFYIVQPNIYSFLTLSAMVVLLVATEFFNLIWKGEQMHLIKISYYSIFTAALLFSPVCFIQDAVVKLLPFVGVSLVLSLCIIGLLLGVEYFHTGFIKVLGLTKVNFIVMRIFSVTLLAPLFFENSLLPAINAQVIWFFIGEVNRSKIIEIYKKIWEWSKQTAFGFFLFAIWVLLLEKLCFKVVSADPGSESSVSTSATNSNQQTVVLTKNTEISNEVNSLTQSSAMVNVVQVGASQQIVDTAVTNRLMLTNGNLVNAPKTISGTIAIGVLDSSVMIPGSTAAVNECIPVIRSGTNKISGVGSCANVGLGGFFQLQKAHKMIMSPFSPFALSKSVPLRGILPSQKVTILLAEKPWQPFVIKPTVVGQEYVKVIETPFKCPNCQGAPLSSYSSAENVGLAGYPQMTVTKRHNSCGYFSTHSFPAYKKLN